MSRVFGIGLLFCDALATLGALLTTSNLVLVAAVSMITSLILGAFASIIRSVLWPVYFWDRGQESLMTNANWCDDFETDTWESDQCGPLTGSRSSK